MKTINVGIIGFGNIGSSVARNIKKNSSVIKENSGISLKIVMIADKSAKALKKAKNMGLPVTANVSDIIKNSNIDIIVETIGGENPAKKIILDAFTHGKSVVTSNKEVVAKNLPRLLSASKRSNVSLLFEAAVGGGTPIISPLRDDLSGNKISLLYGIVNGTTNYVLSRMTESKLEFKEALSEAIKDGYAEPNPRNDIEGYDSAYKAVILSSVAFGAQVKMKDVYVEGISKISQEDINYAREIGYVIKLLAISKKVGEELDVRVHPVLLPFKHRLASISGALNAIFVKGFPLGEALFSAQGAGGDPTSSSVIGDLINIAKRISNNDKPISWKFPKKTKIMKMEDVEGKYYIRLKAPDRTGVLSGISKAFSNAKVSISAVTQKAVVGKIATIVILSDKVLEKNLLKAVIKLKKLSVVKELCSVIRVAS